MRPSIINLIRVEHYLGSYYRKLPRKDGIVKILQTKERGEGVKQKLGGPH